MKGDTPGSVSIGSLLVFFERHEESGEVDITKIFTTYHTVECRAGIAQSATFEIEHDLSEFHEPELRVLRAACK